MLHSAVAPSDKNTLMPRQPKKRRRDDNQNNCDHLVTFDALSTDELAHIFEYLLPEKIMLARLNKKMRDAATKTVVPISNTAVVSAFRVDSVRKYNALAVMTTALPNLQQIGIGSLDVDRYNPTHKFNDGEDPDNNGSVIRTPDQAIGDIGILSNFTRLRELKIDRAPLNGRYPMLFNFPFLQKLHICGVFHIKWDLEMLTGLHSLKELEFESGTVTGNIRSLRVLKDNLSKIVIEYCHDVRGNVMDFADFTKLRYLRLFSCGGMTADFEEMSKDTFSTLETLKLIGLQSGRGDFMNLSHLPHLKVLNLCDSVTGDIRDIGNDDFLSLEALQLPCGVYGGRAYEFQRISDAPDIIAAVCTLLKQRPNLELTYWYAELSNSSPDWYRGLGVGWDGLPIPPLSIKFVKAGSRLGWRWTGLSDFDHPCEINWVDPEPSAESDEYEQYIQDLKEIEDTPSFREYKGFHQPPTEEEYTRIYSEYLIRNRSWNGY